MTSFRLGLLVLVVPVLVGAVVLLSYDEPGSVTPGPRSASTRVDVPALRVLRAWDARRSGAYAAGSARRLRDLYVAGSGSAAADLRVLGRYTARGWRVRGMRMQVIAIRVLEQRPRRLRVEVTDRLEGAVAVRRGRHVALPRDRASTRRLTLLRGPDGAWRVAVVAPVS